jgi:hypothetical protein
VAGVCFGRNESDSRRAAVIRNPVAAIELPVVFIRRKCFMEK